MKTTSILVAAALLAVCLLAASDSAAQTVRRIQPPTAAIATAVWHGDTLYVSGQVPDPVTPADNAKGTPAVYAKDTRSQAESVFRKIEAILKAQGRAGGQSRGGGCAGGNRCGGRTFQVIPTKIAT